VSRQLAAVSVIAAILVAGATRGRADAHKHVSPPAPKAKRSSPVHEAKQMLSDLGYWTGPVDGAADKELYYSLVAFQKVEGRTRTGRLDADELNALRQAHRPVAKQSGPAHIEVDLSRQVLLIVDSSGNVSRVLPVSTGSGKEFTAEGWTRSAITPTGRFHVQSKLSGWKKSAMGWLYYPNYILAGIAIHGEPQVPTSPASHGCIRIPMYAAIAFSDMTPVGTPVFVYKDEDRAPVTAAGATRK
jgi:lipoprotein-anchoring transpeptidase ErfK/SrfK